MRDKVAAVVNYDAFRLGPDLVDAYADMVRSLEEQHYTRVSRYTTSAFMRVKLGQALTRTVRLSSKAGRRRRRSTRRPERGRFGRKDLSHPGR